MKKTVSLLLALSLSSTLFADQEMPAVEKIDIHVKKTVSDDDRMQMIGSFLMAAISGVALNQGKDMLGLSSPVYGVLQVSNVLWHLGTISGNPVFNDLSVRSTLGSLATQTAGLIMAAKMPTKDGKEATSLIAATPFIGAGLAAAGQYTHGLLTVSAYKAFEKGMQQFCKRAAPWNLAICDTF